MAWHSPLLSITSLVQICTNDFSLLFVRSVLSSSSSFFFTAIQLELFSFLILSSSRFETLLTKRNKMKLVEDPSLIASPFRSIGRLFSPFAATMSGRKIKLQSSDGDTFDVDVEIAKQSATIKTMLEGKGDRPRRRDRLVFSASQISAWTKKRMSFLYPTSIQRF